ncbi:hypothetical protein Q73A0000_10085 [Kaistella flava (ex Peng et al. 2021)]|uniref:Uncharacterized protein n=1 Tax=Kaistella flava (ex Peng et al. 2021) TaxID=2038776 RepID=A0A7M2YA60_9FLAO|nr:hypothetical protein [Kaistella flava (ex Peng et al. 2021)]QOW10699.1 hypothetical protein Q73A0000_10085 [Kaistella flava (ex Peng et al. 2021)]
MKKNLFFTLTERYNSSCKRFIQFYIIVFLGFLFTPQFLCASAFEEDFATDQEVGMIYVSGNAVIYGHANISNVKIVNLSTENNIQGSKHIKTNVVAEQVTAKKKEKDQELKKLEDKINSNIQYKFFANPAESDMVLRSATKVLFACSILDTTSFKVFGEKIWIAILPLIDQSESQSKKFFISLSYFQFGNYRNLPLRAPPLFS